RHTCLMGTQFGAARPHRESGRCRLRVDGVWASGRTYGARIHHPSAGCGLEQTRMDSDASGGVTRLLLDWGGGDEHARERMLPLVYHELRRIAAAYMRGERAEHTLQPTALVHEAYLRLVDQRRVDWHNRAQFVGVAAMMMRRILANHARERAAAKRDGSAMTVML